MIVVFESPAATYGDEPRMPDVGGSIRLPVSSARDSTAVKAYRSAACFYAMTDSRAGAKMSRLAGTRPGAGRPCMSI
jgi:hypothetical protein